MATVNFKKIMIATDGSDYSGLAAEKGIGLARLSGGTVFAVCVVSNTSLSMYMDYLSSTGVSPNWELIYEGLEIQAQQAVDYVKGLGEKKGINVESIVLEGVPVDELIHYAEENGMDIIVMGTLGRTGIERLLLGSVAGNVVRYSKVPVVVVRKKHKA
ncbi:Universal stress protein [Methanosarcina barkeri 3]|uniref:Universal stress protein n=1 Tax=Methanosarcina barkeri 3 TaxID=1434107 RepID=A0A0E3SJ09_METBA|nr:universal stress protein [Methanosarcina barkeri]AKB81496.1 Universal stress protein [Methanosarcina barkeri 3]